MSQKRAWQRMLSGRRLDLLDPTPVDVEIEDIARLADALGGVAMAVQAPAHAVGLVVVDRVHLVDLAVTLHAADASVHMNGVVEIDVIRGLVDLHPRNGLAAGIRLPDQTQLGRVFGHDGVAAHAGLRRRDVGEPRFFDVAVAVTAVDPQLIGVDGV